MATGTTQLLPSKQAGYASSSDEEVEGESVPIIPVPVKDGLPQTGPKGVLTDFYRTQQDTKRKEVLEEKRRRELIQKHAATVQSKSDEERERQRRQEEMEDPDSRAILNLAKALEEGALDQDPFVQQYRARRMEEMKAQAKLGPQRVMFGNLIEIRGSRYDNVVETAPPQTFIVIHIYDELIEGCQLLNKCLTQLARQFPTVKFCRVQSYQLNDHLSAEFVSEATLCTCTGIAQANSAYAVKRAHI
jgi:hypothetical protein